MRGVKRAAGGAAVVAIMLVMVCACGSDTGDTSSPSSGPMASTSTDPVSASTPFTPEPGWTVVACEFAPQVYLVAAFPEGGRNACQGLPVVARSTHSDPGQTDPATELRRQHPDVGLVCTTGTPTASGPDVYSTTDQYGNPNVPAARAYCDSHKPAG